MTRHRRRTGTAGLPVRWIAACAGAETLGMTAAAAAARAADSVDGWPEWWTTTATALAIVVAGGLVEGLALGWAQSGQLRRRLPDLRRTRYVLVTVLVAGLGWAGASAPAVLAPDGGSGAAPPLPLVLLGAAGIGLVMGPVLGAAQGSRCGERPPGHCAGSSPTPAPGPRRWSSSSWAPPAPVPRGRRGASSLWGR